MKAIYAFEEELIEKYGDELESNCIEYGADKLKEADRRELSGMIDTYEEEEREEK